MVEIEELEWEPPERPWFKIGYASEKQEAAIREYARIEGFETLRGYWAYMESEGWDYYDILKFVYPR